MLFNNGVSPPDVELDAIASEMQRALELDQDEAARDNSEWASLEWKWESTE